MEHGVVAVNLDQLRRHPAAPEGDLPEPLQARESPAFGQSGGHSRQFGGVTVVELELVHVDLAPVPA